MKSILLGSNMMIYYRLQVFAVAVFCLPVVTQAQRLFAFSEQLLKTLEPFPPTDPIIASLGASIRNSSDALEEAFLQHTERRFQAPFESYLACRLLQYILPNQYTDSRTNQSAYSTLRERYWSNACQLPAACFISPEHPVQIAVTLQVISKLQSRFAVLSGGHNPNPGFAGVGQDGVTIDMQRFQTLELSADMSFATVGAGLRFGAVQEFLDSQGVAVVSGRNTDVGVSGLILGGGHPIINSLTGLAADNVKSMEVVLSDFRVVLASQTENSDLFRALKGGGNNFGIVTKFELYTTMPREIWYRNVLYDASDAAGVFDALAEVQKSMETDPKAGMQMTCTIDGFTVAFVYGEHKDNPAVFAPFSRFVPSAESTPPTNGTTLEFIELQSPPKTEARRDTVGATTLPDSELYLKIYNRYLATAEAGEDTSATFLLPIQTFGAEAVKIAARNGGNALGTSQRAQTWWNPIAQWMDPADDTQVHNALLQLKDYIVEESQAKMLYDPFVFSNIAARDQNVLASYGRNNLELLWGVSHRYDRTGTFQRLQNGGFLVSRP